MKTVYINAEQLKTFGRAERYFLENPVDNFLQTDLILTGFFSDDCFSLLLDYLKRNNLIFNSITFSKDLETIPHSTEYLPAKKIIIPEGIKSICNYAFLNAQIDEIFLPSSLIEIQERAFIKCSFNEIHLSDKNTTFLLSDGILKNSFTRQIILKTKASVLKETNQWQNENHLWSAILKNKCLSVKAAFFWKDYFEKIKPQLKQKRILVSVNTNLDAGTQLKMLLQVLPDSFGNLLKLPVKGLENHLYPYLVSLQYLLEGKQARYYADQNTNFTSFFDPVSTVYCYCSTLLGPDKTIVLFNHCNRGFELIIPELQIFLFFSEEELCLIPAFILELNKNIKIKLKELNGITNDFTEDLSYVPVEKQTEHISQNSRQNVLSVLNSKLNKNDQAIIDNNIKKISLLARKNNFDLSYEWNNQNEIEFSLLKNSSQHLTFKLNYSEVFKMEDKLLELLEKDLKELC